MDNVGSVEIGKKGIFVFNRIIYNPGASDICAGAFPEF